LFIDIFFDHIFYRRTSKWETPVKLATFRAGGQQDGQARVGIVHANDTKLFDLASAAARDGGNPAFDSMLALIDAGEGALDTARALFEKHGSDASLSVNVTGTDILAPLPEPRQMRDGMSFPLHIRQSPRGPV
jgi:hypothetical protein